MHDIINILKNERSYHPNNYKTEIPDYHPDSMEYKNYWMSEIKKCVEGYWYEGRYMPPQLYTYTNFGIIERMEDENATSQKTTQPLLRDIEWLFFYNWLICRKFSGFELDEKLTSNKNILNPKFKKDRATKHMLKSNGMFKEYIDPREYLYMKHDRHLGIPVYENNALNMILLTARGSGKALDENEVILSDKGWIKIKDVSIGDKVYGSNGKLTTIVNKTERMSNLNFYKITLRDGRTIECCENHLWKVFYKTKKNNKYKTIDTKSLFDKYYNEKKNSKNKDKLIKDYLYALPLNKPIEYDEKELDIDPYYLGIYLSDENSHNTENDFNVLKNKLKHLNLLNNKHIPEQYFTSSISQRLALLQGLMDTNGNAYKTVNEYYTTCKRLADDVVNLARSLGIYTTIKTKRSFIKDKEYKICYCIKLITDLDIFRLKRKKDIHAKYSLNMSKVGKSRFEKVYITNINKIENKSGYCIQVNNDDSTYITKDYIVTHNSYWGMDASLHEFIFNSNISFEQLIKELNSPNKTKVNCIITCELEDKANDLMNKVKTWYELMPGSYGQDDDYVPSPLYRTYTGSWGTKITQQIEKYYFTKDGNKAKKFEGSGSTLGIITFNKDPYKTAGKRNSVTVIEEIGLCSKLHTFWNANKDVQRIGKVKFGSTLGIGCVCAGTKVWANDGRLINIEDLKQEDGIIGYDGKKAAKQTINWFKEPATKPCYRIITEGNNIIECSEDHPFIYSSKTTRSSFKGKINILKGSYKEAKNLSVGDYLIVINDIPIFGNVTQDNAYLTGLMLGDGYFKGKSLSVDDDNIRTYVESNYDTSIRKQFTTKTGNTYTDLYIKGRRKDLFHESLINLTRHEKMLPSNIHEYDKESLSLILAGIFDADGSVSISSKGFRVVLTNISENLLKDVKYQLLKFGIHSSIYKENRNIKPCPGYEGQANHIFRLYISKDLDVKRFKDNIPIKHSKKIESLSKFIHGNRDIGTSKIVFKHNGECEDEKYLQHDELLEGYKIQTIKSIEFIGNKEIYNINVSDNHNYICGAFIVGNTGGDIEKVQSAKRIFENPSLFDAISFEDTFENSGKQIGLFIPAYLGNNDFKDERGITDVEEALEYYENERKNIIKNHGTSKDLDEEIMNRPIFPSEMFLSKKGNIFPIQELKNSLYNLISNPKRLNSGINGMLFRDNSKKGVRFEPDLSGKYMYIDSYPIPKEFANNKDYIKGCIKIWEHPDEKASHHLYKIGYDTVHYDFVENPESLISVFVYKGNVGFLSSDTNVYYDAIVAEYTGRYDLLDKNNEIVELMSRYYNNAEIMMEVNIGVNIEYFKRRGLLHLLANQPKELLDKHIKNRQANNMVGYIKSPELAKFLEQSTKEWLEKERGMTEDGKLIRNLDMINSKPLLEELIAYNRDDNFDRVNALFAIMLAYKEENMDIDDLVVNDNKFTKSLLKALPKKTKNMSDSITLF